MKTLSLKIIGLGGLFSLLVSSAFAVSSTPVGYVTLTINGGGYTALSNPLEQAVVHTGTASAINGEVITTSFSTTADSLSATDAQGNSSHYVQTASGLILDITANTDSTITVASGASNITNGDAISVKKYSTIGDLLGTDNSIGLTSGANVTASDVVYIMSADGAGNYGTYYYQTDPFGGFFGGNGWRTPASNSLDVSNVIIAPDDGVIVSRSSPGDLSVVVTGTVNANDHSRSLPAGFSLVAYPFPVDTTLDNSGIYSASNGYVSGANIAASDVVYVIDAAGSFSLYYRQTDPFGGFFGGDGWRTPASNSVDVGANTIPAGSSIIIKHTGSGLNWASTTPYTL